MKFMPSVILLLILMCVVNCKKLQPPPNCDANKSGRFEVDIAVPGFTSGSVDLILERKVPGGFQEIERKGILVSFIFDTAFEDPRFFDIANLDAGFIYIVRAASGFFAGSVNLDAGVEDICQVRHFTIGEDTVSCSSETVANTIPCL